MSLEVIKAGIHDSMQDAGRFGYQHLGINPTGAMDVVAMKVANALVGNNVTEGVLELCFPTSSFLFRAPTFIALSGADFSANMNGVALPINQLVYVPANTTLKFTKKKEGSFCYLAIQGGFQLEPWLNSKSTNTKAEAGGWSGRILKKGDSLPFSKQATNEKEIRIFPWRTNVSEFYSSTDILRCIKGNEFDWLSKKSQGDVVKKNFSISTQSDRMGYRLSGEALKQTTKEQLLSTAVTFGTVQLLPNGNLIVLLADHQTTGGYPRIAQVIRADHASLVQKRSNDEILFTFISLDEAENYLQKQRRSLEQLRLSCLYKLNSNS